MKTLRLASAVLRFVVGVLAGVSALNAMPDNSYEGAGLSLIAAVGAFAVLAVGKIEKDRAD